MYLAGCDVGVTVGVVYVLWEGEDREGEVVAHLPALRTGGFVVRTNAYPDTKHRFSSVRHLERSSGA